MSRLSLILKSMLLPALVAVYPGVFYYGNNAAMILLSSLGKVTLIHLLLMLVVYFLFYLLFPYRWAGQGATQGETVAGPVHPRVVNKRRPIYAALDTALFLLFYFSYRAFFDFILARDIFRAEHFTLLPLYILLALYAAWFAHKIKPVIVKAILQYGSIILLGLIAFNIFLIAPHEVEKMKEVQGSLVENVNAAVSAKNPDIYYIVFDEFAGFKPMRDYWNYNGVDSFKQFLLDEGFFVAEESHGLSKVTLHELATRLNYQTYPCCDSYRTYFEAIASNRAMAFLKSRGYTTVVFEPSKAAFPADLPMVADQLYERAPDGEYTQQFIDEFSMLVLDNSMAYAASTFYKPILFSADYERHRNMVLFSKDQSTDLDDVESPKFVYVHLMLPHVPFVFDANGNLNNYQHYYDWNYYLGSYIYSTKVAKEMVTEILAESDPNNPPVIILQSDHGARNDQIENGPLLENYPEKYKTSILFTLHLPGYDYSQLPQNINPINTFPIVFNHLFDAGIPLE